MTDNKHLYKEKSPHGIAYYAVSMDFIINCLLVTYMSMHEQNLKKTSYICTSLQPPPCTIPTRDCIAHSEHQTSKEEFPIINTHRCL